MLQNALENYTIKTMRYHHIPIRITKVQNYEGHKPNCPSKFCMFKVNPQYHGIWI